MDWDSIGQRWRDQVPQAPVACVEGLQRQDLALRRKVRWRDRAEAVAAVLVAMCFALIAADRVEDGNLFAAGWSLWLVLWAAWVPFRLRQVRRQVPGPESQLPLVQNLRRRRDAALAQARMLEQVWLWYLGPALLGLVALTLATDGLSRFTAIYLPTVVVLYLLIGWANRFAARWQFRAHAEQLQQQIDALLQD